MIAKYNHKSLVLGIPGLLLQFGSVFLSNLKSGTDVLSVALAWLSVFGAITGCVLLIVGLCYYAKAKGYTAVLGLLGLLSCIGLLILAVLPDKTKGLDENAA